MYSCACQSFGVITFKMVDVHWKVLYTLGPQTSQVELPILQNLRAKGINQLDTMQEVLIPEPLGNQQEKGNFIMNRIGMGFRKWCKLQRIEKPPATWSLHLINRGDSDSKNTFPVLDSNVKAAHTKPILFFLSHLATEIANHCGCILAWCHILGGYQKPICKPFWGYGSNITLPQNSPKHGFFLGTRIISKVVSATCELLCCGAPVIFFLSQIALL